MLNYQLNLSKGRAQDGQLTPVTGEDTRSVVSETMLSMSQLSLGITTLPAMSVLITAVTVLMDLGQVGRRW